MGVDYDGVGGVGVEVTEEMVQGAIANGIFTQEEWDESEDESLETLGIPYTRAGNHYSGDLRNYLLVQGSTLGEVNKNALAFCTLLREKTGVTIYVDDLLIIEDICIW